jgi:flagellar protein FlaG
MDIRPLGTGASPGSSAPPAPVPAPTSGSGQSTATTGSTGQAAPATQTTTASQATPSLDEVNHAVQKINTALSAQAQGIEFAVDPTSHHIVVKVVDQSTNQVLRQIPSKEALAIADSLDQSDSTQGLLIKQQA